MKRRTFIHAAASLSAAATLPACGGSGAPKHFVLVHGAWHGGWVWERVTPLLQSAGHRVSTPTLAGLSERSAELSTAITLETHTQELVNLIREQNLSHVILLGHSYGGFPVSGAIEALGDGGHIDAAIYLDAFVPTPGDRLFNYLDQAGQATMQTNYASGDARWPKIPAMFFGLESQADIDYVDARLTDHPSGTYLTPVQLSRPVAAAARRRVYISCTNPNLDVLDATKARVRADPAWTYTEIAAGHDVMVSRARELATLLLANV